MALEIRTGSQICGDEHEDVLTFPSPYLLATSTPKKKTNTPSATTTAATTKDVTKGVKSLQLDDATQQAQTPTPAKAKTMSKNLNVAEEFKKANVKNAANFVVIGEYFIHFYVLIQEHLLVLWKGGGSGASVCHGMVVMATCRKCVYMKRLTKLCRSGSID